LYQGSWDLPSETIYGHEGEGRVVGDGFCNGKSSNIGGEARSLCEMPPDGMVIYREGYLAVFEVIRNDDVLPC